MAECEVIHADVGSLVKHKEFWLPAFMFPTVKFWLPAFMFPTVKQLEAIRNFPLNDDDIMVVTFPKSGCMPSFIDLHTVGLELQTPLRQG